MVESFLLSGVIGYLTVWYIRGNTDFDECVFYFIDLDKETEYNGFILTWSIIFYVIDKIVSGVFNEFLTYNEIVMNRDVKLGVGYILGILIYIKTVNILYNLAKKKYGEEIKKTTYTNRTTSAIKEILGKEYFVDGCMEGTVYGVILGSQEEYIGILEGYTVTKSQCEVHMKPLLKNKEQLTEVERVMREGVVIIRYVINK